MSHDPGLPKEAITEFKKLYKAHYGAELSDGEATIRATNLIDLYDAVYEGEPLPPEEHLEQ